MNRRLQRAVTGAALSALILVPSLAQAQGVPGLNQSPEDLTLRDVVNVLVYLVEFGLAFAAATGMIFIVTSGYQYILSAGNPEKVEKAKQSLTWSITGFILAISSTAIVFLLQKTLLSKHTVNEQLNGVRGPESAASIVESLIRLGFYFAGAVAVLFLIFGGYRYVTSSGNQDQIEGAKKTVLYAVIGLVVVFAATLIFRAITNTINVTP